MFFKILFPLLLVLLMFNNCAPAFRSSNLNQLSDTTEVNNSDIGFGSAPLVQSSSKYIINTNEILPHVNSSDSNDPQVLCKDNRAQMFETRSSNITQEELANTISNILGVSLEDFTYPFFFEGNELSFPNGFYGGIELFANEVSAKFIASLEENKGSAGANSLWGKCDFSKKCTDIIIEKLPNFIWRKKISNNESKVINQLISNYSLNSKPGRKDLVKNLLDFLLTAPQFYSRNNIKKTNSQIEKITDIYVLASKISFAINYSAPDFELMDKIFSSEISTESELLNYLVAKIDSEEFQRSFVKNFFGHWFGYKSRLSSKDEFAGEDIKDLANNEYQRQLKLFSNNSPLSSLIKDSSGFGVLQSKLFALNTYKEVPDETPDTNIVFRGLYVMSNVLCMDLETDLSPALESAIDAIQNSSSFPSHGNNLEKAGFHRRSQTCNSCHQYIDYLAIGLESLGPFGKLRTNYPNKSKIDLSVDPLTSAPYQIAGLEYSSTEEYTDILSKSVDLKSCFAKKIHQRSISNFDNKINPCLMTELFDENQGLKDIVKAFVKSEFLKLQKKPSIK